MRQLFLAFLFASLCYSQKVVNEAQYQEVITDSIVWITTDIDSSNLGDRNCRHDWVYSEAVDANANLHCGVLHVAGEHCEFHDRFRERICRKCKRYEVQREKYFQHVRKPEKTEFEQLKEELSQ